MNLSEEMKKYDAELSRVRTELNKLDANREGLIKHGLRVEGALAFLREAVAAEDAAKQEAVKE